MFDLLTLIISFFLLGFLVLSLLVVIKFFQSLVNAGQSNNSYCEESNKQLREDSQENSQADLYMSEEPENYDNLMFPEEFGDDY
jgi:hypothetical protein